MAKERWVYDIKIADIDGIRPEIRGYHRKANGYSPEQALSGAFAEDGRLFCYEDALYYYRNDDCTVVINPLYRIAPRKRKKRKGEPEQLRFKF